MSYKANVRFIPHGFSISLFATAMIAKCGICPGKNIFLFTRFAHFKVYHDFIFSISHRHSLFYWDFSHWHNALQGVIPFLRFF